MSDIRKEEERFLSISTDTDGLLLEDLKSMLKDAPSEEPEFTLDEILSEYGSSGHEKTSSPAKRTASSSPLPSTAAKEKEIPSSSRVSESVKPEELAGTRLSRDPDGGGGLRVERHGPSPEPQKETPAAEEPVGIEKPFDPSEIHIDEKYFGPPEMFNQAFVPSDKFVGQETEESLLNDDSPEEPEKKKKKTKASEKPKINLTPAQAAAGLQKYTHSLGVRTFIVFLICLPLIYLTAAHRTGWYLPSFLIYLENPHTYLLFSGSLLIIAMFCGLDLITAGIRNLFTLRPGMESLTALSCFASVLHNLSIFVFPNWGGYLPYTAVAALSLLFSMWGSYLKCSAMRWSLKTASQLQQPMFIAKEETVWQGRPGFVKFFSDDPSAFVEHAEAPDAVERFARFFSPLMIICAVIFALMSSVMNDNPTLFLLSFSAILAPIAALPNMLSFSLPYFLAAKRLSLSGAALAGWTAARILSDDAVLITTDNDLFPPGTVTLNGIKVLNGFPIERVISYAASLISASGSGLSHVFSELLRGQSSAIMRVDGFQHFENGGLGGEISGNRVLLGTPNFLLRMGIRVPREYNIKTGVLISINHELAGVIALNYSAAGSVTEAMYLLSRHHITPVLATRDFNMTPLLVKDKFGVSSDFVEFPVIEDRLALSDKKEGRVGKPVAAITREGLLPFVEATVFARKIRSAARKNIVVTALGAVLGMLLMYFLCHGGSFAAAAPVNLMIYMAAWLIPMLIFSSFVGKR